MKPTQVMRVWKKYRTLDLDLLNTFIGLQLDESESILLLNAFVHNYACFLIANPPPNYSFC